MYAEKSTNLLRQFRRFKLAKKRCLLVKYTGDNRYTDQNYIATHDKVMSSEQAVPCHQLSEVEVAVNLQDYDVICIDEIQFFPDKLLFCQKWRSEGKIVIASGLYANFQRKPFEDLPNLIALADKTEMLTSICHDCVRDQGSTSYRLSDEQDEVVIGGHNKYLPLCQVCYENREINRNVK